MPQHRAQCSVIVSEPAAHNLSRTRPAPAANLDSIQVILRQRLTACPCDDHLPAWVSKIVHAGRPGSMKSRQCSGRAAAARVDTSAAALQLPTLSPMQEVVLLRHDLLERATASEVQVGAPVTDGGCKARPGVDESRDLSGPCTTSSTAQTTQLRIPSAVLCTGQAPARSALAAGLTAPTCSCAWSRGRWPP